MSAPSWLYVSFILLCAFIAAAGLLARDNGRPSLWNLVQVVAIVGGLWWVVERFKV